MEWEEINIERCPTCGSDWDYSDKYIVNCSNKCGTSKSGIVGLASVMRDVLFDDSKRDTLGYKGYTVIWDLDTKRIMISRLYLDAINQAKAILAGEDLTITTFQCAIPFDITLEKLERYILFS
jgi:hypothetical protein